LNALELNLMIFNALLSYHGPQGWWPAKTRFEVIAGAVLTQNVSWKNAKESILNLQKDNMLSSRVLSAASVGEIAGKITPSRFYNQKALTLKIFCSHLEKEYGGSLDRMFRTETSLLRKKLLELRGIGPETVDCILLYAGKKLSFVSDAYTRRFLDRYGIIKSGGYEKIRGYFMDNLPEDIYIYNEFHALIDRHCGSVCKVKPSCFECPVRKLDSGFGCDFARSGATSYYAP
jgi:endonuclease III related protein